MSDNLTVLLDIYADTFEILLAYVISFSFCSILFKKNSFIRIHEKKIFSELFDVIFCTFLFISDLF